MDRRAVTAWGMVVATLLVAAARVALSPGTALAYTLTGMSSLVFVGLGAVVVTRRNADVIGWLMVVAGTGFAVYDLATVYAHVGLVEAQGSLVGAGWAAWVASWVWVPGFSAAFLFLPLLFPDGRLPSHRWRPVLYVMLAMVVMQLVVQPVHPGGLVITDPVTNADIVVGPNPLGLPALAPAMTVFDVVINVGFFPLLIAVAASVVVRYRRSRGVERYQLRWFLYAVGVLPLMFALSAAADGNVIANAVAAVAATGVPVAIGVAVLRYRLYEIDRLISRTVTYALVSAVLAAVYAGVAVLPSALLGMTSDLLVAAATLAAAGVFVPVRRRVQHLVDRRFNRTRYDAEAVIARFGARLRDQLDIERLEGDVRGIVVSTVQPMHVSLWLHPTGRAPAG